MNIDGLLSRFRIQTKIFLLVTPFVLSIILVGLVGLYSNQILRGRIEISNVVLQSMDGYKQVFASISGFLRDPVKANYQKAVADVDQQKVRLSEVIAQLKQQTDVSALEEALAQTSVISSSTEKLWALEGRRQDVLSSVRQISAAITEAQARLGKATFKLVSATTRIQNKQKAALKASLDLDAFARQLYDLLDMADKTQDASQLTPRIEKTIANLEALDMPFLLPDDQKDIATRVADQLAELKAASQQGAGGFNATSNALLFTTGRLSKAASEMMHGAVLELSDADKAIADANTMNKKLSSLVANRNTIDVAFARLSAQPTKEQVAASQANIYLIGNIMDEAAATAGDPELSDAAKSLKTQLEKLSVDAQSLLDISVLMNTEFSVAAAQIDHTWGLLSTFANEQKDAAREESSSANQLSVGVVVAGIIIAVLAGFGLILIFRRPISQITNAMRRLAEGVLETAIQGDKRRDEIGDMARALGVFKSNALEKLRVETLSEEQRLAAEAERQRNDAERQANQAQIDFAVRHLASALQRLSDGDLTCTISTPFAGGLEELRNDFNASVGRLNETLSEIMQDAYTIQANGNAMRASADELSRRTETQAASLEQTAAAVEQITATVRQTAGRAGEASDIVRDTRKSAESSVTVVSEAVDSMARIEDASRKIEQIIDVIEDIAFQTNLLALNAGIEAARAGEAGKGFAVVAMEVRELAQRSAGAANEIKSLIDTATHEVSTGVRHVQRTGDALGEISTRITELHEHVQMISRAAQDQSAGLQEVNSAVNQMDQMTQANAAMVEETNAMSQQLAGEGDHLMQLVSRFQLHAQSGRAAA